MKKHLSLASFAAAVLFGGAGLLLPPQGEIDSSVLIFVAQLLVLCATLLGIKDYSPLLTSPRRGGSQLDYGGIIKDDYGEYKIE